MTESSEVSEVSAENNKKTQNKKKRKWNETWRETRSWLKQTDDGKGMFCAICSRFAESSKAKWTKTNPCFDLQKTAVTSHEISSFHQKNVSLDVAAPADVLFELSEREMHDMKRALCVKFMQIYYLAKEEHAVFNGFSPLHMLLKKLGIANLEMENKGNANYSSNEFIAEAMQCICETIVNDIIKEVGDQYFSLLVDETTDIAAEKQLILYIRYQCHGQPITRMFGLRKVEKTDAETLLQVILDFL